MKCTARHCCTVRAQRVELLHAEARRLCRGLLQTSELTHRTHTKPFLLFWSPWAQCERWHQAAPICCPPVIFFSPCSATRKTFHISSIRAHAVLKSWEHRQRTLPTHEQLWPLIPTLDCGAHWRNNQSTPIPPPDVRYTGPDFLKLRERKHGQKLLCAPWLMTKLICSGAAMRVECSFFYSINMLVANSLNGLLPRLMKQQWTGHNNR